MRIAAVTPVEVAAKLVDLPEWFFTMSDAEYRAASKAHLGFGISTMADGRIVAVCVEQVGGMLMLHHYGEASSQPDHLQITSPRSQGWLVRMLPVRLSIMATLHLRSVAADGCELVLSVEAATSNPLLRLMLGAPIMHAIMRRHLREELEIFARDIARKYASRVPVR